MTASTRIQIAGHDNEYAVEEIVESGSRGIPSGSSATRLIGGVFDRFGLATLPFAAAAAIAAPLPPAERHRVFSGGERSGTHLLDIAWWVDDWVFTTEAASNADVQALFDLLALPAAEGLSLDLPD